MGPLMNGLLSSMNKNDNECYIMHGKGNPTIQEPITEPV